MHRPRFAAPRNVFSRPRERPAARATVSCPLEARLQIVRPFRPPPLRAQRLLDVPDGGPRKAAAHVLLHAVRSQGGGRRPHLRLQALASGGCAVSCGGLGVPRVLMMPGGGAAGTAASPSTHAAKARPLRQPSARAPDSANAPAETCLPRSRRTCCTTRPCSAARRTARRAETTRACSSRFPQAPPTTGCVSFTSARAARQSGRVDCALRSDLHLCVSAVDMGCALVASAPVSPSRLPPPLLAEGATVSRECVSAPARRLAQRARIARAIAQNHANSERPARDPPHPPPPHTHTHTHTHTGAEPAAPPRLILVLGKYVAREAPARRLPGARR